MSSDSKPRFALIDVPTSSDYDWTDNAATFGTQMALIHNVFIRCLNSIYHNAPLVKKDDEASFVGYCLSFTAIIHDHHHGEEEIIFPFLQEKFDMKCNVDQHQKFTAQLEAFEHYLNEVGTGGKPYDGHKARELVEVFGDTLVEHLHDEVSVEFPG